MFQKNNKKIMTQLFVRFLLMICVCNRIEAAAIEILPTQICFQPGQLVADLHVTNSSHHAVVIQSQVHSWLMRGDKQDEIPTKVLIPIPPIFKLPSHKTQVIRLFLTKPLMSNVQKTYRLIVSQVPMLIQDNNKSPEMKILLRFSLPVYVFSNTKKNLITKWVWNVKKTSPHEIMLHIINTGNTMIFVSQINLLDKARHLIHSPLKTFAYIFPHQTYRWKLEMEELPSHIQTNITYPCLSNHVSSTN